MTQTYSFKYDLENHAILTIYNADGSIMAVLQKQKRNGHDKRSLISIAKSMGHRLAI